jgi:hypothetical protein
LWQIKKTEKVIMPKSNYHLRFVAATLFAMCLFVFTSTIHVGQDLLASAARATTTYYISSTGNDANPGTSSDAPWQSIANIQSIVRPGDTILFNQTDDFSGLLKITASEEVGSSVTFDYYTAKRP